MTHEKRVKVVAEFTQLLMNAGDPFDKAFEDAKMLERRIYKDSISKMLGVNPESFQVTSNFTPSEIKKYLKEKS